MFYRICTVLIIAVCCTPYNTEAKELRAEGDVDSAWEDYKAFYGFKSADEKVRKRQFSQVHSRIEEHNRNSPSYKMKHNRFSILNEREKKRHLGAEPPEVPDSRTVRMYSAPAVERQLTALQVDHRGDSCLQPIKDQRSCGSCWAFAAVAPLEFMTCRKSNKSEPFSEQQLVDCSMDNFGCDGGWPGKAWQYVLDNQGIETSFTYPYESRLMGCHFKEESVAATVSAVNYIATGDTESMKSVIANHGPIAIAISVVESFFNYGSGVYVEPNCRKKIVGWHAMSIVGYGNINDIDYWVVRNSWNSDWGAGGYILFKRGVNQCSIESYAAFPTI